MLRGGAGDRAPWDATTHEWALPGPFASPLAGFGSAIRPRPPHAPPARSTYRRWVEFLDPQVILFVGDCERAAAFYAMLGFRETFRAADSPRGASTAIYFVLRAGERSRWHRVDADEIWHHYAGEPLELSLSGGGHGVRHLRVGTDFEIGELPQAVVPRGVWQAARSLGRWTLVGCTVAPGFHFAAFELAPRRAGDLGRRRAPERRGP